MTPEGRVKQKVKKALDTLGADCWRFMPVQTGFGSPALDYLLTVRGRFVAIETKAPGKKLTPLQEGTKAAIEAAGGIVLVVWDETSLELAMKIILALEFEPYDAKVGQYTHLAACLNVESANYTGPWHAQAANEETARRHTEHCRGEHSAEAAHQAARGHHGAPPKPPKR